MHCQKRSSLGRFECDYSHLVRIAKHLPKCPSGRHLKYLPGGRRTNRQRPVPSRLVGGREFEWGLPFWRIRERGTERRGDGESRGRECRGTEKDANAGEHSQTAALGQALLVTALDAQHVNAPCAHACLSQSVLDLGAPRLRGRPCVRRCAGLCEPVAGRLRGFAGDGPRRARRRHAQV